jgi:uncharacterized membrane protein
LVDERLSLTKNAWNAPRRETQSYGHKKGHRTFLQNSQSPHAVVLTREYFEKYTNIFHYSQGEVGRMCIYRALCEAKYLLKPGRSFIEDVIHTIFR